MGKKDKKNKKKSGKAKAVKAEDLKRPIKLLDKLMSVEGQLKKARKVVNKEIARLDAGHTLSEEGEVVLLDLLKKFKKDIKKFRNEHEALYTPVVGESEAKKKKDFTEGVEKVEVKVAEKFEKFDYNPDEQGNTSGQD